MPDDNVDIRVRLQGGKVVAAEAHAVADGVDAIGDSAQRSGRRLGGFERVSKRIEPVLAGIGRITKTAGIYLGGFGAAAAAFGTYAGLKFNATMEQNSVAFSHFLGSAKRANRYLKDLYHLAATTPFEFEGLVSGARKFLAFGFAAKEAKNILKEVGDTAAGLGGGTDEIERMVLAFGQMKAKGRIQSEELMQLQELGVPALKFLSQGLRMSQSQVSDELRKGAIGAQAGIKALRSGMRREFGGMSKEQSKTFSGQLSTLKDNAVQMVGELTKPVFGWLKRDVLPALNAALPGIQKWIKGAIGKLPGIFDAIKGGVGDFIDAIKPARPMWDNVLFPLLKGLAMGVAVSVVGAIKVAVPVLKGLMVVLGAVGKFLAPLKGAFEVLGVVVGFIFAGPILKAIGALGKFEGVIGLVGKAATALSWPIRIVGKGFLYVAETLARLWLRFSPVGILLRNLPGLLQKGVAAFTGFASKSWGAVKSGVGNIVTLLESLGGKFFSIGKNLVSKFVSGLKGLGTAVVKAFGSGLGVAGDIGGAIAKWINDNTLFADHVHIGMPGPIPDIDFDMPGLANGGIVRSAGSVLVGERGPEVLSLNRGARVDPLPRLAMAGGGGGDFNFTIPVTIDGKEVGRAMERYQANEENRR
ncbi:MAG TPA: tape measure protein [Solirubrobacterales bacterium]|nr:tape measure protein [Solirubrobacterales bacterium]